MHQHKVAVFDLSWEHAELRLDVRARVVVRDNKLAVGRAGLLREGVVAPECEDKEIAVQTADERAVVVRHNNEAFALRKNPVQFFMLFLWEVNGV